MRTFVKNEIVTKVFLVSQHIHTYTKGVQVYSIWAQQVRYHTAGEIERKKRRVLVVTQQCSYIDS